MTSIKLGRCQSTALRRIRRVLRQELATELLVASEALGLQRNPPPLQRHILRTPPADYKTFLANCNVWCGVYATTDTRPAGPRETGSAALYTRPVITDIEAAVVFRWLTQEYPASIDRPDGTPPEEWEEVQYKVELTQLRADAYAEALLECVMKYTQDGVSVDAVEFRSIRGTPNLPTGDNRPYGISKVTVRVYQSALISGPVRLPDPTP